MSDRVRALDRVRVDQLVAAALLVEIELQVWLGSSIHDRLYAGLAASLLAGAVAVRRRWPLAAVFVVLALMSVRMLFGVGSNLQSAAGVSVGVILLFYGLGAFASGAPFGVDARVRGRDHIGESCDEARRRCLGLFPMEVFAVLLPYALGR